MYRMIAIDVDDTLFNDDRIVSDATKLALIEAVKKGVIVTLATGRMYASTKQIAEQVTLNVPLITYNGSLIKNLLDETVLYERSVPKEVAEFVFNYAEKHDLHLQAYHNDQLYVKKDNQRIKDYSKLASVPYIVEPNFQRLSSVDSTKLLIFDEPAYLDQIAEDLAVSIGEQVHITKSKPYFLEILHKDGTKGHAVQFLANHYGCELSEVIAIGDSWNDREMINLAGLGVAMGNAIDELKEIADFITYSNNEDGVRHVLEKFVL